MVAQKYPMITYSKFNFSTRPPDWSPVASNAAEADTINKAKEFIKEAKEASPITELQKLSDWQLEVMESPVPVILDCYAEWCAPCKTLDPRLTEKVLSYQEGQLKLVKLNIDSFPQLSTGLSIKQIPAVFLIFKGNVVDMFQGLPDDKTFDEFFQTALLLNSMATDQNIMEDVMSKVKQMITDDDFAQAETVLADSYQLEEWRSKYGTQMIIGLAYCRLFKQDEVRKDTANIRASLENLTEQKIMDCEEFYQDLAYKIDNELERLELIQLPDDREQELRQQIAANESNNQMPNLDDLFDLATHLHGKNRMEEAIELLLEIIAIDRNWNKRAAQTKLTDIFKQLGATTEIVKEGRKKLSKLLF